MRLEKYQGLGNDFLLLVDLDDRYRVDAACARVLCDRHLGVGADGIIRIGPGRDGAEVTMELRNADGSEAETSGNGLRCLALALVEAGLVEGPRLNVLTGAGPRSAVVGRDGQVSVDMGPARLSPAPPEAAGNDGVEPARRAALVDVGNPHLVVLDDGGHDVAALGRRHPQWNVELVRADGDNLDMLVWERGVGETAACGTGACAAAAAAHEWGLVGSTVTVRQPGGELAVELGDTVVLTGPAGYVCTVEVPCP